MTGLERKTRSSINRISWWKPYLEQWGTSRNSPLTGIDVWLMHPTAQDGSYGWQGSCNNSRLQDTGWHQIMMMLYIYNINIIIYIYIWIGWYPYNTSTGRYRPSAELVAGVTTWNNSPFYSEPLGTGRNNHSREICHRCTMDHFFIIYTCEGSGLG